SGSAGTVVFQIQQCFGSTYRHSTTHEPQTIHECIVACTHEISTQAQDAISAGLDSKLRNYVSFLSGQRLWELVDEHLGARTALAKLKDAGGVMENASPHH